MTEETLRNKEAGMHAKRELYLWMVLVRVVVGGASNLFVPPMCDVDIDTVNYCNDRPTSYFMAGVPLSVQYEAGHINVIVPGTGLLVGGLLAYGCNSTDYNETCTVIFQGTVLLQSTSLPAVLSPGTQCVFFGCYSKGGGHPKYQFQAANLTIPPLSLSSGVPQVTSSAPEPIMVQMSTNSSVLGTIRPTPVAVATVVAVTTAREPSLSVSGDQNSIAFITTAVLAVTVMVVLAVVGSLVCANKLRKKCQDDRPTIEWSNEDYKPVKIAFTVNISCSLSTIIDSLEKPQVMGPSDHPPIENPNDFGTYLKTCNLRSPEQDTQTNDFPIILIPSVSAITE